MDTQMSQKSINLLRMILSDPIVKEAMFVDPDEKSLAKNITIRKNGSIVLGKVKSSWLNRLFHGESKISFDEVVIRIVRIFTGHEQFRRRVVYDNHPLGENMFLSYLRSTSQDEVMTMLAIYYIGHDKMRESVINDGKSNKKQVTLNITQPNDQLMQCLGIVGVQDPLNQNYTQTMLLNLGKIVGT